MAAHHYLYLLLILSTAEAAKILILNHIMSKSHHISFVPMVDALAERNHDVTFVSFYPYSNPNVTTLLLKEPKEVLGNEEFIKNFVLNAQKDGARAQIKSSAPIAVSACNVLLNDAVTKTLLKAGKQFDVAVVNGLFGQCAMITASLLAKHLMYYYTCNWPVPWMDMDVPMPYSFVPNTIERFPLKMDFWQRMQNLFTILSVDFVQKNHINGGQQKILNEYLPDAPKVNEIHKFVDFHLINTDPVTGWTRPSMPNIVDVGAMHCREAKPLPKDLNDFVEDSGDEGFIVFGLGSNVKSQFMTSEFREAVLTSFKRLKQKVIWKFEGQLDNIPKNVKITKWMPQQNLLAHPKARLFITHAGLLSIQEAIYHGVPVIGMPFFTDQQGNIARIKNLGLGEILDFVNVTADSFYPMIKQILDDKSYYENMKKYSAIFKDHVTNSVDNAVFWIEYVIRHDGAHHFRSAGENLNFFEYFLLDVILFIVLVSTTALGLGFYLLKFIIVKMLGRKGCSSFVKMKQQ